MTNYPEIVGQVWFNSKPLKKNDLAGKVVLFDFWTYSCVNCKRTIPYLADWFRKYGERDDFVMIGIHTPEFEFEKDPENVRKAMEELGVKWPVVLDNEMVNWSAFANKYWPAKYLANKEGKIIYTHFGEGDYGETEAKIRELLGLDSATATRITEHGHGNVCFIATPETYCGYKRGRIVNESGYVNDQAHEYKNPGELKLNELALAGKFTAAEQYVQAEEEGAEVLLNFQGTEINLVFDAEKLPVTVDILLNNELKKTLNIDKPKMYNLLKDDKLITGTISVRAKSGKFRAFAFTFSGCSE